MRMSEILWQEYLEAVARRTAETKRHPFTLAMTPGPKTYPAGSPRGRRQRAGKLRLRGGLSGCNPRNRRP